MSRGRSRAYWAANRYPDEAVEPDPAAPRADLPRAAAGRFSAVRRGLRALDGAAEHVRYMGLPWRWAWEYAVGSRKLCWLHIVGDDVAATFTLSDAEEGRLRATGRLTTGLVRVLEDGQRTGPVKWCWIELHDRRVVEAFLRFMRRKAEGLAQRAPPRRAPRTRPPGGDDVLDTD
jgi:hypothetical protein